MSLRSPHPLPRTLTALVLAVVLTAGAVGCSGDDDDTPKGGASTARAVVDLHLAASRRYDLAAVCQLLPPAKRAEMAAFDGTEADGYCTRATGAAAASADAETKARTRRLYTGAKVTELDRTPGTWFRIEAADGTYGENIETVEVDGRWWVAQVESDLDVHQHEEGDEHVEGDEGNVEAEGGM